MRKCRLATCRKEIPKAKESDFYQKAGFCGNDCMADHGIARGRAQIERKKAAVARQERAQTKEARERIKTRSKWLEEAQTAFNAFVRWRDKDLPCICCNQWPSSDDYKPGGYWDAGHFLSRGAFPELRFEELNCHKQQKSCNAGSSKYAKKGRTVSEGYRENLIRKIGQESVDWLEGQHEAKHYTIEDLKRIKQEYKDKLKELRQSE